MSRQTHASITERFAWQPRSVFSLGLSAEELGVFCHLSNMAAFKDLDLTTRAGKLKLLPGQLYSTIRQLGEQLKLTKDKVARVLKKLSEMGLVTLLKTATKAATHGSIVSVCHLTKFPPDGFDAETMSATNPRQECDTNKKREKEEKEDSCRAQAPDDSQDDYFSQWGAGGAGTQQTERPVADEQEVQPDERTGAGTSTDSAPEQPEPAPQVPPAPPELYPETFNNLWAKVPKAAKRGGKAKPFAIWKKASAAVRAQIELGVIIWAKRDGDRTEFVPMAQTWFNQRRWETEIEQQAAEPEPKSFHDAYAEFEDCPA